MYVAIRSPLLHRVQRGIATLLVPLADDMRYAVAADILSLLIMVAIASFPLLMAVQDDSFRVVLIGILVGCMLVWGYVFMGYIRPALERRLYGPLAFDSVGGIPRRRFLAALACSDGIAFRFAPVDMMTVRVFNQIDREITEQILKFNYRSWSGRPADEVEERWPGIWKEQILGAKTVGIRSPHISFDDALSIGNVAFRVETLKLEAVERLSGPIVKLFQVLILLLAFGYLLGRLELVAVMQIGLLMSVLNSALLFLYHARHNTEIPLFGLFQRVPEHLVQPFRARLDNLGKRVVSPAGVSIQKGYLAVIREYLSIALAGQSIMNVLSALVPVAIIIVVGVLEKPILMGVLLPWYRHLCLALLLIPVGMLAGHYITFLALQNLKALLVPVVITVLSVFLPYALDYLLNGLFNVAQPRISLLTLGTAVVAALISTITARVKKDLDHGFEA